jgi:16S rRNA (adenine1518-N6/adenine1519-N6)-dimethyltransferase
VARLTPLSKDQIPYIDARRFAEIVARAFGQRRKTLRNTLHGLVSPELMIELGIDPIRRGETLSVDEFARLANRVTPATV